MPSILAQFIDLGHQYKGGPELFKGVTLDIEEGSFHFLTGPSGSGKSSFLRMLYLDLKPTWGTIQLFGEDVSHLSPSLMPQVRQKIGVVFQEFKLLDHLTVLENVCLPLRVRGNAPLESHKKAKELLDWVALGDALEMYPPALSGGQKQRVAIARAVIVNPHLLLADEPTGNVDDEMAMKIFYLLEELNRMGTAVILATHNPRLLERSTYPQLTLQGGTIKKISKDEALREAS
jgi:cell division transport system ATP-binding protein